jgi:hypothetical protein
LQRTLKRPWSSGAVSWLLTCVIFAANSEEALEQWRRKLAEAEEVMTGMEAMMTATEEENRRLQVAN